MKTHISEFCYKTGRILFGVFLGLVVLQLIGYWAGIRPVAVVSGSMEPVSKALYVSINATGTIGHLAFVAALKLPPLNSSG